MYLCMVFDGSTRLGEALAIVLRYCSGWAIKQKLVHLSILAKSLCGEEVAREVLTVLSTELGIPGSRSIAIMRDHAAVNNVAARTLAIMYFSNRHRLFLAYFGSRGGEVSSSNP